jgi:hypothetical protein
MGNSASNQIKNSKNECFICRKNIDSETWSTCIRCNIILHELCEEKFRGEKNYCQCPHCLKIGTIGTINIHNQYILSYLNKNLCINIFNYSS